MILFIVAVSLHPTVLINVNRSLHNVFPLTRRSMLLFWPYSLAGFSVSEHSCLDQHLGDEQSMDEHHRDELRQRADLPEPTLLARYHRKAKRRKD